MSRIFVFLLLLIMSVPVSVDAQRGIELISPAKKVALVIGNSGYLSLGKLKNPVNDAAAMARQLRELDFDVILILDAGHQQMDDAIERFTRRLGKDDVGLFYYAGHGTQSRGENYLIPVDFQSDRESDLKYKAVAVGQILDGMQIRDTKLKILVLDTCRNNPLRSESRSSTNGWAAMNAGRGTFIAFATAPDSVADDNPNAPNGLFTEHLLKVLREPGLGLDEVFGRVRARVDEASSGKQLPWSHNGVVGEYFFRPTNASDSASAQRPQSQRQNSLEARPPQTRPAESESPAGHETSGLPLSPNERIKVSLDQFSISPDKRTVSLVILLENLARESINLALEHNDKTGVFGGAKVSLIDDLARAWYVQSVVGLHVAPFGYRSLREINQEDFTVLGPATRVRVAIVFSVDNNGLGIVQGYRSPGDAPSKPPTTFSFAADALYSRASGPQRFSIQLPSIKAPR